MRLRTLPTLGLSRTTFRHAKPLLLLAYLSLEGPQPRGRLATLFWPRATDARNRLSVTLTRLRRALPPGTLSSDGTTVRAALRTDVDLLRRLVDRGRLATALRLYRGPFLADVTSSPGGEELEEWLFATRERVADQLRAGCVRAAAACAEAGRFAEAGAWAERAWAVAGAAAAEPGLLRSLHTLLLAAGHPAAATLRREADGLGLALHDEAAEARASLLAGASGPAVPHNLRPRATSFVGRDAERVEIGRLLVDPGRRLVTLVGPGGIGKSRLAEQVATDQLQSGRFPGGVWFVRLEEVRDGAAIPAAILEAMRAAPRAVGDPWGHVADVVAKRRVLLVLDDVEHLAGSAPRIAALIEACPNASVLATSREPWAVHEEWIVRIEGLAYPRGPAPAEEADGWAALELFADRARQVEPGFRLAPADARAAAAIADMTDGSPLALELAAAWVGFMSAGEIAAEVERDRDFLTSSRRDVRQRHQSLRAVFDHSWRLLADEERDALAALAVFRGGFDRAGAQAVTGATPRRLAGLAQRSLIVRVGADRYARHPLVHQYSEEKLAERPAVEAQVRTRHAAYVLQVAEAAAAQAGRSEAIAWLERLETEHANVVAALAWADRSGDDETLLRLVIALVDYWIWRGHHEEAVAWFARVTERDPGPQPRRYAAALLRLAFLGLSQGHTTTAPALIDRSLALAREAGDTAGEARAWSHRGMLAAFGGDYPAARSAYERALALARTAGDDDVLGRVLNNLGDAYAYDGDPRAAIERYRESLAVVRGHGDLQMASNVVGSLGMAALALGDRGVARDALRESLRSVRALGIAFSLPTALDQVACLLADEGGPGRQDLAAQVWGAAEAAREALRLPAARFHAAQVRPWQERAQAGLGREAFARAWATGRGLPAEVAADLASSGLRSPLA